MHYLKNRKVLLVLGVLLSLLLMADECSPAPVDLTQYKMLENGLEGGAYSNDHRAGDLLFKASYSTPYNVEQWKITEPKEMHIRLDLVSGGDDFDILVENMHAEVSLVCSAYVALHGWEQDSMDDRIHMGQQEGFLISSDHPYQEIFSVGAFDETHLSGRSYEGTGWMSQERMSEHTLRNTGKVVGNRFKIVFDVLIKKKTDKYFYKVVFADEFVVPVGELPAVQQAPTQ